MVVYIAAHDIRVGEIARGDEYVMGQEWEVAFPDLRGMPYQARKNRLGGSFISEGPICAAAALDAGEIFIDLVILEVRPHTPKGYKAASLVNVETNQGANDQDKQYQRRSLDEAADREKEDIKKPGSRAGRGLHRSYYTVTQVFVRDPHRATSLLAALINFGEVLAIKRWIGIAEVGGMIRLQAGQVKAGC
jgi:hypothetical protein